jgi:7-cyano-7-deazaguanine reductase
MIKSNKLRKSKMSDYTTSHARSGVKTRLPGLECFENQFRNYQITISIPEFTSVCPKTGIPDFGKITIRYTPNRWCVELKSLKIYILAYRSLGIFYENAVNRILIDFVEAVKPVAAVVTGEFNTRGGMTSTVEASYPSTGPAKGK